MIRLRSAASTVLLSAAAVVGVVLCAAAPAAAHVTVNADEAVQGGFSRVAVRVPNESPTASTVKVELMMPVEHPVASVSTQPVPGWTVAVAKGAPSKPVSAHGSEVKEVVTKVTWTAAAGGGVKPGEFQEFPVSMGPLPHTDQLVFKALQTYSDGVVARWIQEPTGGEEPENPAPVLELAAATGGDGHGGAATDSSHDGSSTVPMVLSIVALVLAAVGAALGALALARSRKPAA
ncbi:MAG TPA: YcnI family protein [Pilimelia sp.]|nr:YcnI family protein [Pilimelia sp.]